MSTTPRHPIFTDGRGAHSLHLLVRRVVAMLLGERNAINLYGEDHTADDFEAEAKRLGATVVACNFSGGHERYLDGVIDPLSHSEEKQGEEKHQGIPWPDDVVFCREGYHHAECPDNGKCVPPVIYLKPGERITHMMMRRPNAAGEPRPPQDNH